MTLQIGQRFREVGFLSNPACSIPKVQRGPIRLVGAEAFQKGLQLGEGTDTAGNDNNEVVDEDIGGAAGMAAFFQIGYERIEVPKDDRHRADLSKKAANDGWCVFDAGQKASDLDCGLGEPNHRGSDRKAVHIL